MKAAELAVIDRFNRATGKRLGVVLTEHVQFKDGQLFFNTIPSRGGFSDDYLGAGESFARLRYLLSSLDYTRRFYTLGDYPSTAFLRDMKIDRQALPIAFPPVRSSDRPPPQQREFDLVFTGAQTAFRAKLLARLEAEFRMSSLSVKANEHQRGALYRRAGFILNIPQNPRWKWSSPMRILAGLDYGRTTVSIRTNADSEIDAFAFHYPDEDAAVDGLRALLARGPAEVETETLARYQAATSPLERWAGFRRDLADWAVEEGVA